MENENVTQNEHGGQDLLADEASLPAMYEYATQGQRFVNWLIDNLVARVALSYLAGYAVGYVLASIAPDFLYDVVYGENKFKLGLLNYMIVAVTYIFYYTLCEKLFRGYTLGKLVSGTRAIRQDGNELTLKNALLRSLSRIVPFEVFSGFSTLTWHDSWTKTMVIKAR